MKTTTLGKGENQIPVSIFENGKELAKKFAAEIVELIEDAGKSGRKFYLGCPCGRSPLETYHEIAKIVSGKKTDLSHLVLVMMDEYAFKTAAGFECCPDSTHYSCKNYVKLEMLGNINKGLPAEKQIKESNVWFPDIKDPSAYDVRLEKAGGVDLFILACGESDFHVAFNPPGSSADSKTRIIHLNRKTKEDNLNTFPDFKNLSEVPEYGLSVGMNIISNLSKKLVLIIHGKHKQHAVNTINMLTGFCEDVPASIIYRTRNSSVYLDAAAAGNII